MINMNQIGFSQEVANFDTDMNNYRMSFEEQKLENSSGFAIQNLNGCITNINSIIDNTNSLFSRTSGYLHKAEYNINLCEANNSSTGS